MSIDFKVNASDVVIRQASNGWIVFEVSPDGNEVEVFVLHKKFFISTSFR